MDFGDCSTRQIVLGVSDHDDFVLPGRFDDGRCRGNVSSALLGYDNQRLSTPDGGGDILVKRPALQMKLDWCWQFLIFINRMGER
ncbi:hypothetical protein IH992_31485 [Candidatus Poribacteria bacterium]|nr:hypothetical protein [Candidatus Poribacteria bacterium]